MNATLHEAGSRRLASHESAPTTDVEIEIAVSDLPDGVDEETVQTAVNDISEENMVAAVNAAFEEEGLDPPAMSDFDNSRPATTEDAPEELSTTNVPVQQSTGAGAQTGSVVVASTGAPVQASTGAPVQEAGTTTTENDTAQNTVGDDQMGSDFDGSTDASVKLAAGFVLPVLAVSVLVA